ncbi:asparaginase [Helicobacter sp. 23-1045]
MNSPKVYVKSGAFRDLAKIAILATGGTIAGKADDIFTTTKYKAGVLGIETLINATKEIKNLAQITFKQVANIDSCEIDDRALLKLARHCENALKNADGVVITHGTDTMEESAYFLHLVMKGDKPIVLTGAMRPFGASGADGGRNLYNAVALAANPRASGVMVAMNDRIFRAREVQKTHTMNVNAFEFGEMGCFVDGEAIFSRVLGIRAKSPAFNIAKRKTLPKVDVLCSYAGDGVLISAKALFANGAKGIIIACSGAGSICSAHKNALKLLVKKGLKIVIASRVKSGFVKVDDLDFISARDLSPQKARILLSLSLTQTNDSKKIAEYFLRH